jgi:hypothetical protein
MTAIFIAFIFISIFNHFYSQAKQGKAKFAPPVKPVKTATKAKQPSQSFVQRMKLALYGDKALVAELCRCDGDIIEHRTYVRVQWMNSITSFAEDGLQYHQFQMVLGDGKRLSLPMTEKDGKLWVTYQGQRYNRWDSMVRSRTGLLAALRGENRKPASQVRKYEPVFG